MMMSMMMPMFNLMLIMAMTMAMPLTMIMSTMLMLMVMAIMVGMKNIMTARMKDEGRGRNTAIPGGSMATSARLRALARRHRVVYSSLGVFDGAQAVGAQQRGARRGARRSPYLLSVLFLLGPIALVALGLSFRSGLLGASISGTSDDPARRTVFAAGYEMPWQGFAPGRQEWKSMWLNSSAASHVRSAKCIHPSAAG